MWPWVLEPALSTTGSDGVKRWNFQYGCRYDKKSTKHKSQPKLSQHIYQKASECTSRNGNGLLQAPAEH